MTIKDLEPHLLWKYFYEITQVPRPSKKEGKIIDYLLNFAKEHELDCKKDEAGNVLITKPATPGFENLPCVILQGHVDMVCEKNSDKNFDFDNEPIQTIVDGDWLRADGTTLGADNGIGVAAALAILASDNIQHGKLECLFTVDEETGLTGAYALEKNFLTGNILINLDTEEEGKLYIGCAGGRGTKAIFKFEQENVPGEQYWIRLDVKGLKGGHSGSEIHVGLGNANKILNRFLWMLSSKMEIYLSQISGGNLHNAIAREASAVLGVPIADKPRVEEMIGLLTAQIKSELKVVDPGLEVILTEVNAPEYVMDQTTSINLINSVCVCPHGVLAMSHDIPGLVECSTNLASIKLVGENTIEIGTSQRSSTESLKNYASSMVNAAFTLAGAVIEHSEGYPGWKPNPNSEIVELSKNVYKKLNGNEPELKAIHAGLECGLFLEKYPHLDMISFGPSITGAHSPEEQVNIPSVSKWWNFLLEVLKDIPVSDKAKEEGEIQESYEERSSDNSYDYNNNEYISEAGQISQSYDDPTPESMSVPEIINETNIQRRRPGKSYI